LLESRQLPSAYTATSTTYEAIDLEPGQTDVTTLLDGILDGEAYVNLGSNTFTFYGTSYTGASSLKVSPHGLIGFGSTSIGSSYVNSSIADTDWFLPIPMIAPLWDDWTTDGTSSDRVLAKIDGDRLIIEWSQVTHWPDYPADTVTFQAILELNTGAQSGDIIFNYVDVETIPVYTNGVSATVGVRPASGSASPATQVSFDATHALIGNGKAILLNPAPTALGLSSSSIAEDQASGSAIGTFSTTDDDSTFTYSLVTGDGATDNDSFTIVDGDLRTATALNFEVKSSYSIRVRTTDSYGGSFESEFTISVTDVNEDVSDTVDVDATHNFVLENAPNGSVVGVTAFAADPDGTLNTVTYSLADNAGGRFAIHSTTGVVTVANGNLLDYESATSHTITVLATSADGSTSQTDFTIAVGNIAPSLLLSAETILENLPSQTIVGTLTANEFLTSVAGVKYTFVKGVGGENNGSFAIKGDKLIAKKSLNFEAKSSYSVRIQVKTTSGETQIKVFTISVVNVNEHPGQLTLRGTTIAENNLVGAEIGLLSSHDPDIGDVITWSLVSVNGSNDTSAFSLDGARLLAAQSFDYETTPFYDVIVRATDHDGLSVEKAFRINVTNVNDAPTGLTLTAKPVLRSAKGGTTIGLLSGLDPDSTGLTFKLVDGDGPNDNSWFTISGRTLKTRCAFEGQLPPSLTLLIRVTDSKGLFYDQELQIVLIDL